MYYLDTSFIGSALRHEDNSAAAQRWLESNPTAPLWTSDWTMVEFSSAMARRVRIGDLTPDGGDALFKAFLYARSHFFMMADPPGADDYDFAAQAVRRYETGLRAGDALHIAVARKLGQQHGDITLVTFDEKMASVAPLFGLPTVIPA